MHFTQVLTSAEKTGWGVSLRSGQLVEPASGYLVPVRRAQWWSVHERRLTDGIVKLYVYSRAQQFTADPQLMLHIRRVGDYYQLATAVLVPWLHVAFSIAYLEDGGDVVYDAASHAALTRDNLQTAA